MSDSSKKSTKLVLFDLDGTLTHKDTMIEFIRFVNGDMRLFTSYLLLGPMLVAYKLGLYPNDKAKKNFLRYHFKGHSGRFLREQGALFCKKILPTLFKDDALEKLHFHRAKGHEVVVISASLDIWVEPWLANQGLKYITTIAAWDEDGNFAGDFASPNCYGPEKVRRLKELLDPSAYARIYAYGDSRGDKEMLAFADRGFYRRYG